MYYTKSKDRVTGIPLKTGDELMSSERVSSSSSKCGIRRVTLATNPVTLFVIKRMTNVDISTLF